MMSIFSLSNSVEPLETMYSDVFRDTCDVFRDTTDVFRDTTDVTMDTNDVIRATPRRIGPSLILWFH